MVQTEEFRNPKAKNAGAQGSVKGGPAQGVKGGRGGKGGNDGGRGKGGNEGGRGKGGNEGGRGKGGNEGAKAKGGNQATNKGGRGSGPRDERVVPKGTNEKGKKEEAKKEEPVEVVVTAPDAPTIGAVTLGKLSATVAFFAPKHDGNAGITSYTVTTTPGGLTVEGPTSPIVVSGLSAGISYTFSVSATNSAGSSDKSGSSAAVKPVPEVIFDLLNGSEKEVKEAASGIATTVKSKGLAALETAEVLGFLRAAADPSTCDKNSKAGIMSAVNHLLGAGPIAEAFCYELLPFVMDTLGEKFKVARIAAEKTMSVYQQYISTANARALLPIVIGQVTAYAWQAKLHALQTLLLLAEKAPDATGRCLETIVPVLTNAMGDGRAAIVDCAQECMSKVCDSIGNRDVKPFISSLVSCMARPQEVPEAVNALAGTTFVQTVDAPALSIMCPVLIRGLAEGTTAVKRQTCVIIENFAKLVENPEDVRVFLPKLLPGVERASTELSDPEARTIACRSLETLQRISKQAGFGAKVDDPENITKMIRAQVKITVTEGPLALHALHAGTVGAALAAANKFDTASWTTTFLPYLVCVAPEDDCKEAINTICKELEKLKAAAKAGPEDEDEEGEDLCNCEFSLAYGSQILLSNARLRLKRGRRYGLVGPNGVGKSTLMRSIVGGQIDGFPPPSELRTVYVECDISPDLAELNITEFVMADPQLKGVEPKAVYDALTSLDFTDVMKVAPVTSLSGGWRMKLALARAMLKNADILLLDEPTNHLDVANVSWVVDYLCSLTGVTSIIVSHDAGFLERACSDVIHFNYLKLKNYRGSLRAFVEKVPEAKAFFELKSTIYSFKFPDPAFLEGVKSRGRAILKMAGVGFTYPGTTKQILHGIDIQVSMASRCAVVGPNGAGKSTMIKLLTGELVADAGTVWKHPNLILAYVAQHAFHHIESHLTSTPNEYIRWRFQGGEDRESLSKLANMITDEDEATMKATILHEGVKCVIKNVLSRRKGRRGDEYEVEFASPPMREREWMSREKLAKFSAGWEKVCRKIDLKALAETGSSVARTLSTEQVEKHLGDLGLEPEFATHTRIDSLSTSQKVKVVLAAATWNNPHIIVLDEPTNYLDRESLGALAQAIRDFKGGVIMISHNNEFTSALCPETWNMKGGKLIAEGVSIEEDKTELVAEKQTEGEDGRGNKFKVKQKANMMNRKERKAWEKRRADKIKNGIELSSDEEDF